MEVNITLVAIATLAQFVLGALWYSPLLFGKWWMIFMDMDCASLSKEELEKMQKAMMPFYALQLFVTFLSTFSLANLVPYVSAMSVYHLAFWIWIGFIVPVQVSSVIWGNTKKKFWLKQIFVVASNQLVSLMLAAWILSM